MNKPVLATLKQCFGSDYHKLRVYTDLYEEGSQSHFVLKEIGSYMGCKSYHRLLKKLPASAVQKRLIKNSGGRMHRMLLVSEEGVLALLKHCSHKAATGFKRYLETCVIPVIRREIDTARIMLPESEKTHKDQVEKENMEEAIRMLSSALAFQVIKNQELETRLEIVEERLLQTAAA
ncbi:BRO-N domain-containing protein [Eubacterium callanderi]|uniref:BRO-N domain-containing protein n=1 Tax=Eubacterium callanderi TaxID=53442 RepID=UPI001D06B665|nr:hypothetical protein [Eubacterium callanderi]MCB6661454.1 hypothetical protein [Eubacterium callanderi]MCB6754547.1 hypothetical protein [Eubacterium callanderi]MCB7106027.1 hypothetical protein [Eubacterium callanderi]MCG4821377.1 hypothetical protein [Eubacterium callanderi]MCQ5191890.1 hypothetical protein [Eubacterium callanderi]